MNNQYTYISAIFEQFQEDMGPHQPVKGRNPGGKNLSFLSKMAIIPHSSNNMPPNQVKIVMNNWYTYIPAIFEQFQGGMGPHQPVKGRNPGVKIRLFYQKWL